MAKKAGSKQYSKKQTQQPRQAENLDDTSKALKFEFTPNMQNMHP